MAEAPHLASPGRIALGLATLVAGLVLAGGFVIGTAAGVGAAWHATDPPGPARAVPAAAGTPKASTIHLLIKDVKTPVGEEPAYIGPSGVVGKAVLFQANAGTKTSVTIVNKSQVPHSFTSSALGVNVTVPPGPSTVHFTIDPKKPGKLAWRCTFPCGAWVMAHVGYMQGFVDVTA